MTGIFLPDEAKFPQESCMDFKIIWRTMAEIDPPVGMLTFFKQALVGNIGLLSGLMLKRWYNSINSN